MDSNAYVAFNPSIVLLLSQNTPTRKFLKAQAERRTLKNGEKSRRHILIIPTRISFKLFPLLCLQVEAGDVILKVNGTDVHRYSTKEGKFSRGFI